MKLFLEFCQLLSAEIRADCAGGASGSILGEFACNVKTGRQRGERTRRTNTGEQPGYSYKVTAQRSRVPMNTSPYEHSCAKRNAPRGAPPWNFLHACHIFQAGIRGSERVFGTRSLAFACFNNASDAFPPRNPNRRLEGQRQNAASTRPRRRFRPQPQERSPMAQILTSLRGVPLHFHPLERAESSWEARGR